MKTVFGFVCAAFFAAAFCLAAPHQAAAKDTTDITDTHGTSAFPVRPKRIVIMDFGMLDTLEAFKRMGLLDEDVQLALAKKNLPAYLSQYTSGEYVDVGGLKDFNLETIYAFKPDLIIISGRQQDFYDELRAMAPVWQVNGIPNPYIQGTMQNIRDMAKIFDVSEAADRALAAISESIQKTRDKAEARNLKGLVLLTNDGKISAYGSGSRFGVIHDALGVKEADSSIRVGIHGQLVNYEYIAQKNPDIIFVVDRSVAVTGKADGARLLKNDLVDGTKAAKNGRIISLDPNVWYLSGGGLISLRMMIDEVNAALEQ